MSLLRLVFSVAAVLVASGALAQPTVEHVQIDTAKGTHRFEVEVMRSRPELEQGLMYRRYMPADRGMLFDFQTARPVMMWMKNTYLPLDMVFIGTDGKVINVAHDAEPMSEKIIPSEAPALGVLELNAGTADKIGVKAGDSVRASIFPKDGQ